MNELFIVNVEEGAKYDGFPTGADMQRRQSVQGCLCAGIKRWHRYANTQSTNWRRHAA